MFVLYLFGVCICSNEGTSSIAAPYVRLEAGDNAFVRFSETDAWSKSVEFLATSEQSPASSLRAGETVEVPVFVYTATEEAQATPARLPRLLSRVDFVNPHRGAVNPKRLKDFFNMIDKDIFKKG